LLRSPYLAVAAACIIVAAALAVFYPALRRNTSQVNQSTANQLSAPSPKTTSPAPAVALFLPAAVLRGTEKVPTLQLENNNSPIELQIEVRASEQLAWSATLARGSSQILHRENLKTRSEGPLFYVSLQVPPGQLTSGNYQAQLIPEGPSHGDNRLVSVVRLFTLTVKP
jgi:hypothetical protein